MHALLVLGHDVAARDRHHELGSAVVARAGRPRTCACIERERHGLSHLPADELLEIVRPRRQLLEPDERHLGRTVRNHERHAPRARADRAEPRA